MPNEFKVKNGLIVDQGGANVTGSSAISGSLSILSSGSSVFTVDGTSGRLFSVDDSLSGSLFSVNTAAGLPVMEAFSDNTVRIGQYGQRALFVSQSRVGIGKESALGAALDVSGSVLVTGSLSVSSGITGSLFGTASWAQNAVTSSLAQTASFLLGTVATASYAIFAATSSIATSASYALTASYALNAGGATSAFPYTGSARITGSINLTGSIYVSQSTISTVDWIDFTVNPATPPHSEGRIHWNVDRKTLQIDTDVNNFMIPAGHASVLRGRNTNSYTLTKGTVVFINGNSGQFATFGTASWEDDPRSAYTIGIIAQDINTNNYGYAVTDGEITGINTNAYAPATLLYLSSSGQYTDVKPIAPNHTVRLGQVVVQSTNGILQVKVDNGYETDELHDVLLNNTSSGDLFVKSGSLWINSKQLTGSYGLTGSINITGSLRLSTPTYNTSSINVLTYNTASTDVEYSTINDLTFTKNIVNVGLSGSRGVRYNVIKNAVASITDASENNTYTVRVYPGIYIEDTITVPSWVAIKGDSSISTVVSASNPSSSLFVMSDQSMLIDMQIQGCTFTGSSAVVYSSPTTPQRNAIAYVENVRFGTNYTNAKVIGSGSSGNCILQCSNVKYGGYTDASLQKSFDVGFHVTSGSSGGIGRMQLRNVTSTNGGVAGTDNNQIFALADAPGCTFIVNGCLLTRATGAARGTAFKVYNGGQLRLTAVNFQRWINGIWAPQTGSAPSIDAIALNFENCTTDVLIEHTGSTGKVQGTDNFLKTQIALNAPLYEVGQDPRRITVGTKGADFTSISASVAYITDSSANNRYVIEVGPGQFTEKMIDLTGKPYVSIVGSNIQTTQIFPSSSNQHIIKMGINNEVSFLSLSGSGPGYSGLYIDDVGDFAQAHKISIYNCDRGVTVNASTTDTQFYGEYIDINGTFSYGTYVSSSNGASVDVSMENYFLFPSASATVGNFVVGPSSSLGVRSAVFTGDSTAGSVAFQLQDGATLEASSVDIPDWDTAVYVPNIGSGPTFRMVGTMIHNSVTYDFNVQNLTTIGRFQGISDHSKINNASDEFYWNFLDDTDGENDVTRKLSVTFADGTHTDATTLIFKGSPMGVMQGGTITISSGLTITTAAGFGYLQDSINTDVYKRLDWNNTNITLAANSNNYIYLNDNGILSASGTVPDNATNIILGRVVTNDTGVEFIDQTPYDGEHTANKLSKFNREALGPVFAEGSIVTENVTPFKLDVTQGNYYFSENNFLPAGTSSINLTQYYQSASVWARYTSSVVPSKTYASGSALVPMSASYYTKHTVYLVGEGVDEEYFLVINNNQYSSLISAENADLPTIPTYFNDGVVPLAAVYVQSGSANITQIQDIRPIIGFRAAGVNASSVHGNLLGLTADDHLQYLRVDGFRQMTGDLGLGGNDLYNIGYVSASAITASGAIITDIQATSITGSLFGNATTATNATSASYAFTASSAISAFTASSAINSTNALTASSADNFVVRQSITASNALINGTITAQTLVVQTITSSTDFVTGSTRFGSTTANTHVFTGSVSITGSLTVTGRTTITDLTGSLFGTASWAQNFITSSVTSASFASTAFTASSAVSSSVAISASFAQSAFTASSAISSSFATSASRATSAGNASTIDINVFGSDVESYLLMSNVAGTTGVAIGGDADLRYNASTNRLTVGTVSATILSGSLFGTASWAQNFITSSVTSASFASTAFTASSAISSSIAISSSFAQSAFTASSAISSSRAISSSFAITASYALSAVSDFPFTGSAQITGSLGVTGSIFVSNGGFTGSLFGTSSWAQNFITSSVTSASFASTAFTASSAISSSVAISASFAQSAFTASSAISSSRTISASFAQSAFTASSAINSTNALTASFVNTLNQNVLITGSLTVGSGSVGSNENTLILGPSPAGGPGEGGQILLAAPGGIYTSASMWDNFQDQTRLLRGTNAGSDAVVASFNMHTKQFVLPQYNSTTAFTGTTLVGLLGFDANGNVLTTNTGSGGGGGGVTINNNTNNYLLTATGTANTINGESNLQFDGSTLSVTGNVTATAITSSGAVIAQANGAMYFRGGDDAELWDINVVNTLGIYGQQDQTVASVKLGNNGGTLSGWSGSLGVGTTLPVSGTLHVNGNVFAASLTGSLLGTASWATNAISSSYPIAVTGSTIYSTNPQAGIPSSNSTKNSIFLGSGSGFSTFFAEESNFLGLQSGYQANNAFYSNFLGSYAGFQATNASDSNFFGYQAGFRANGANKSVFIGNNAGYSASAATFSNFIGPDAGNFATNAYLSNFIGNATGQEATNAFYSTFIGENAGFQATNADNSNFIGADAGRRSTLGKYSNFIGYRAGSNAASASYSILIGYQAGYNVSTLASSIKSNNIVIGTNITLPEGAQSSINVGGLIFATGSYSTTTGLPFSGSANGRVGINQPAPQFTLDVSGSGRYENGLTITGSLISPNITGSLFGTASWAQNFITSSVTSASFAQSAFTASSAISSSFALTASFGANFTASNLLVNGTITAQTLVVQTITSSTDFVTGSTRFGSTTANTHVFTGSVSITGSFNVTGRATITDLTGSLFGTASWAQNFITSSVTSASFASTAFTASSAISSSNAITSSYAFRADQVNGYDGAVLIYTGSQNVIQNISGTLRITGSLVVTGSLNAPSITGSLFGTASYVTGSIFTAANPALSASYALTASYALNGGGSGGGLKTKAGNVLGFLFSGNPKKATVTFATPFATDNYAVTVTGQDARSWTIESQFSGSFVINSNSNTSFSFRTYWIAVEIGES